MFIKYCTFKTFLQGEILQVNMGNYTVALLLLMLLCNYCVDHFSLVFSLKYDGEMFSKF